MPFDDLTARFDDLFARLSQRTASAGRAVDGGMTEALVEAKAAVRGLVEALGQTERILEAERRQHADAARRGDLARQIGDAETAEIASRFAARHAERVRLLEQKLAVQQAEVRLAEQDLEEMTVQVRAMRPGGGGGAGDAALDAERLRQDARVREEVVAAQLAQLKRKLGKEPS